MCDVPFRPIQYSASFATQGEAAASGEASRMKNKRLIESVANTRPKRRIYREIGLVSKNVQSAQLVPGFGKAMQGRLKGGCESAVGMYDCKR